MIITCPCGNKSFEIDGNLIPKKGRTLQCGACSHKWFFIKEKENQKIIHNEEISQPVEKKIPNISSKIDGNIENKYSKKTKKNLTNEIDKIINKKDKALIKYEKKENFTFGKFLSYIIVIILSLIAIIIILDTFKNPLEKIFPNLELILYNLYETMKDIMLFLKDLTK